MTVFTYHRSPKFRRPGFLAIALACFVATSQAQTNRVTATPDSANRFQLAGHVHPLATADNDAGRVDSAVELSNVTFTLAPTVAQQTALDALLLAQRTPGTSDYHRRLTPEEYANRFGISFTDLGVIKSWLEAQGLTVSGMARSRTWISVSGTAGQMESAFQTEIHRYVVRGQAHIANASALSLPVQFNGVVRSIRGLNDFHPHPFNRPPKDQISGQAVNPRYTSGRGNHYIAPADLAAIYDFAPLYSAGIDGTGQKLVVVGQTQIQLSDIETFRSEYGLAANDPQVTLVPGSRDPGISKDDIDEANLDLEWSGAVARNASILYVYAYDVTNAVQYAIDQNLAPVVSMSYGACESEYSSGEAASLRSLAQQANAQGITWFAASGDSGAADCADINQGTLAVDLPGSIPEVTSVGGTEFQEGSVPYWATANSTTSGSATGYIPETSWNDSATDGQPSASGGGASQYFTRPLWQNVAGVPGDTARHVPDIAMNASADHDGYLVYSQGSDSVFGGTSLPTPIYAGLAALLNQNAIAKGLQTTAGLGNINPNLYSLYQSTPAIFHDVTTGDNIVTVTCTIRQRNCTAGTVGYTAGPGYDQVTGLGSVDANSLVTNWNPSAAPAATAVRLTLQSNVPSLTAADTLFVTATATTSDGSNPTGTVRFTMSGTQLGSAALTGSAGTATATVSIAGSKLPVGAGSLVATWSGGQTATLALTVLASGGTAVVPSITSVTNAASFTAAYAPGEIVSVFGSQLAGTTQAANSVPLPLSIVGVAVTVNGIAAPVWYVSPGQLNIQFPYEVTTGSSVALVVNNNGQLASTTIPVSAAAPAIFSDTANGLVPTNTGTRGQTLSLYVTGAGLVSPAIATGAAPSATTAISQLPAPQQSTTVTVGGVAAPITFIGIPAEVVGVVQINFQVPSTVAVGSQPVVVTVGNVASRAATLLVTQ